MKALEALSQLRRPQRYGELIPSLSLDEFHHEEATDTAHLFLINHAPALNAAFLEETFCSFSRGYGSRVHL